MIYMRLRVDWGVICLYLANKKSRCPYRGKGGQKGKKVYEFHFRLEINIHYYFHAIGLLLKDFEIFDNFDHIFYLRPLKVGKPPLGQKFELEIQIFDQVDKF